MIVCVFVVFFLLIYLMLHQFAAELVYKMIHRQELAVLYIYLFGVHRMDAAQNVKENSS